MALELISFWFKSPINSAFYRSHLIQSDLAWRIFVLVLNYKPGWVLNCSVDCWPQHDRHSCPQTSHRWSMGGILCWDREREHCLYPNSNVIFLQYHGNINSHVEELSDVSCIYMVMLTKPNISNTYIWTVLPSVFLKVSTSGAVVILATTNFIQITDCSWIKITFPGWRACSDVCIICRSV